MMENKNTPKIKILIACHKADPNIRQDHIYMPIQVGKTLHPEVDLGFQNDNTGDNISEKNEAYCELTAIYWAWKNLKDVDYIGLCHYRRYFDMDMSEKNILKVLDKYDGIVLSYRKGFSSALSDLNNLLTLEDTAIMINELLKLYPDYKKSAIDYLLNNNAVSQCNMFILPWNEFDKYCNFIFPLLERIEKKMKTHAYSRLRRNLGYISECLQGLYIAHNHLNMKLIPKLELSNNEPKRRFPKLRDFVIDLVFALQKRQSNFNIYSSVITGLKQDGIILENLKQHYN